MKTSISIVIPIYNAEKTLKRCLDSVIASIVQAEERHQDSFSGEIICVNDGSTDSSESIILEYQKRHKSIKYVTKSNGGGSDARNKGIDAATGEYLMFCDSDDAYEVSCVKQIVDDIFEFSPYYICFGRTTVYLNGEKHRWSCKTGVHQLELDGRDYINSYLPYNGHSLVVFNKVYKRQILNQYSIRFDTSLRFGEDVLFNLLYMRYANGPLFEDFRTSYLQYKTEGSLTTSKQINFFTQNTKCMDVLRETCPDWYEDIEQFVYYYYIHSADLAVQRIVTSRDSRYDEHGVDCLRVIQKNKKLIEAIGKFDFSQAKYLQEKSKLVINGMFSVYKIRYCVLPMLKKRLKNRGIQ